MKNFALNINSIYIASIIFIMSSIYSIVDIYIGDKFFTTNDYFIATIYFLLYKFIPAILIGNIHFNLTRYKLDLIVWRINLFILILSFPTFLIINNYSSNYLFGLIRQVYSLLIIFVIFFNITLGKYSILSVLNTAIAIYITNSKIFMIYITLMLVHENIKNNNKKLIFVVMCILISMGYVLVAIESGYGRDSEISYIAYIYYNVEKYGKYTGHIFSDLITHAVFPNYLYQLIFDNVKNFIHIDNIISNFYANNIEDYNTNPVIPFIFTYGKLGIGYFLALYYLYIYFIVRYMHYINDNIIAVLLYINVIYLIMSVELDIVILIQLVVFQMLLILFNFIPKLYKHVANNKYTSNSIL